MEEDLFDDGYPICLHVEVVVYLQKLHIRKEFNEIALQQHQIFLVLAVQE